MLDSPITSRPVTAYSWSEGIGEIAAALAVAQALMGHALKDSKNPHFQSRYADLASVREACAPISEQGIAMLQFPTTDGKKVSVTTLFAHKGGQWIQSTCTAEARAADPQSIGSAVTYLRRYGLLSMACVAPADDDGNAASQPPPRQEPRSEPAKARPLPTEFQEWLSANRLTALQFDLWRKASGKPGVYDMSDASLAEVTGWLDGKTDHLARIRGAS